MCAIFYYFPFFSSTEVESRCDAASKLCVVAWANIPNNDDNLNDGDDADGGDREFNAKITFDFFVRMTFLSLFRSFIFASFLFGALLV